MRRWPVRPLLWKGNWWLNAIAVALPMGVVWGVERGPLDGGVVATASLAVGLPLRYWQSKRPTRVPATQDAPPSDDLDRWLRRP
jgi:hypothetical protein